MKVYFAGAGPGDPDLLTVKAKRLLESCTICIYAGSLVGPAIVNLIPTNAEKYDSAGLSLDQIISICRGAQDKNKDVLRLHSGDPSIYGAIGEQMSRLDAFGIDYEVVPGISSFQAAAAALQTELTAPEISQTIILTRSSGRTPLPEEQQLCHLAKTKATLCIFLSVHKMREVANSLAVYYGDDCPIAVVHHASRTDQRIFRGVLCNIADQIESAGIKSTAMIIVGRALLRDNPASKLYDSAFSHGFRSGNSK